MRRSRAEAFDEVSHTLAANDGTSARSSVADRQQRMELREAVLALGERVAVQEGEGRFVHVATLRSRGGLQRGGDRSVHPSAFGPRQQCPLV